MNLVFPERRQEKTVKTLSIEEILALPKRDIVFLDNQNTYSLFSYRDPKIKALIWELKYHRNPIVISKLGLIFSDLLQEELLEKSLFKNINEWTLLSIPISRNKLRERGFCQTDLLCREIMKNLRSSNNQMRVIYEPDGLKKIKDTKSQSWTKNKEERMENLKDAFSASPKIVGGKNIILIDDVLTTGSTVEEVRKTLLKAGANEVFTWTIAH